MSSLLLVAAILVGSQVSRDLAAGSKPALTLPVLEGLTPISASEYKTKDKPTVRVYRYTYKADYQLELQRLRSSLPTKDSWIETHTPKWHRFHFERASDHNLIKRQALILFLGRWIVDAKGPTVKKETGWVGLSYHEVLR